MTEARFFFEILPSIGQRIFRFKARSKGVAPEKLLEILDLISENDGICSGKEPVDIYLKIYIQNSNHDMSILTVK